MLKKPKTMPVGVQMATPYLIVRDGAKAIEFYKSAFGAQVLECHPLPDGKIMHASLKIGDSIIMLSDEMPESKQSGMFAPASLNGTSVVLHLYVEDVDSSFNHAVKAGAKVIMPVMDAFWGDRYGQLQDPFGHLWSMATPKGEPSEKQAAESCGCC